LFCLIHNVRNFLAIKPVVAFRGTICSHFILIFLFIIFTIIIIIAISELAILFKLLDLFGIMFDLFLQFCN